MATSVSVVLHRTVPLLMLLISENMSMVHCTCSGGGHTEIEPGDCQSYMLYEASVSQQV